MITFTHSDMPQDCSHQVQDHWVLVVGGGQAASEAPDLTGNGQAICVTLARRGVRVICADRDLDAARSTVAAIQNEGGQAVALRADISQPDQVSSMFAEVGDLGHSVGGLVLNAGISDRRTLGDITPQSWDNIFDVNLRGHMLCARAALPIMVHGGAIVFISSVAALLPAGRNPTYEASKAALSALCRAVALEGQERDIRANVVQIGLADTPMGRAASAARPNRATGQLPFGRQATAWDTANAVCFLLSLDAAYINAIDLRVDGGLAYGITRPTKTTAA